MEEDVKPYEGQEKMEEVTGKEDDMCKVPEVGTRIRYLTKASRERERE